MSRTKYWRLAATLLGLAVLSSQGSAAGAPRAHHRYLAHPANWSPSAARTEDDPLYLDDTPRDTHTEDDPLYLENYQPPPARTAEHYFAGADTYDAPPPDYYLADRYYGYPMPGAYREARPAWRMGY